MYIRPTLGNVVFIMAVSGVTVIAGGAAIHYFSRKDVPVISPIARGANDFITRKAA